MTAASPVTTSFNGGELSPLMAGRADTAIYAIAVAEMENFVPCIEGPMQKCPGFRRIRLAALSSTWLMRFVFNQTQSYVLECGATQIRFYTNGGRIETGDLAYQVAVPFAANEWPRVSAEQSHDRLYMAHGSHPPGALTRNSATTFAYAPLALKNGPFKDGNTDQAMTVTVAGAPSVGGTVTVTASAPIFESGHVGAMFQVEARDFADVSAWEVGLDGIAAGSTKRRSDGKVYVAASSGRTGTVAPIHDEGTEWDGSGAGTDINGKGPYGVQWTYLYDRFGIVRIDAVTSATVATGTVIRRIPDSLDTSPSWRWAHAAFSDAAGWPDLVFLWAGRLCFWKGFDLYASVVGDYLNHQAFTSAGYLADDLAFRLTLAAADAPLWVKVDRDLVVGTASDEYAIGAINAAAGVSGVNIAARRQSGYGSAPVWPIAPGTSLVFAQRGAKQLREAEYDFGRDRYLSANINRWARHVCGDGVIQLGQQQQTEELLFAVRSDGQLVLRSYDPEQQVKGFARRVLAGGGKVLSAVCIPNEDGTRDDIWALCRWGTNVSVQRMADWWQVSRPPSGRNPLLDAFYVDDGLSDELIAPSATVSGLDHLTNVEVAILADGVPQPRQTVPAGGVITLPVAARVRTVGRPYTARMTALRPETGDERGQSTGGRIKRVARLALRLIDTWRVKADAGLGEAEMTAQPSGLFSGDTDDLTMLGASSRDATFTVTSDDPLPAFVLAAMPRIEVGTR